MSDPFSGNVGSTKQEVEILEKVSERKKAQKFGAKPKKEDEKSPIRVSELYSAGIALLRQGGFTVELDEAGEHVKHKVLTPQSPPDVKGITYHHAFRPLQDISTDQHYRDMEAVFFSCGDEKVKEFWAPMYRPKAGDSDLQSFAERMLKMRKINQAKNIHQTLNYGHTFDPAGKLGGEIVLNPRIWVPDRDWFDPALHKVTFEDVFTIFPEAEREMLRLILGRVGVGRSNHLPPGRTQPVDHTARMAGVIVGKDAGLGKSTLFNGLTAALQRCGFVTHTFKSTEDRFGLKSAALSDISYKDDTSLASLKKFLAAEETKILITNGLFQV